MSYETRIGLFAVIVIGIFFWGYSFLKGQNVLTSSKLLYVEYKAVDQLAVSAPVTIKGFQVGTVQDMVLEPKLMQSIIVTLNIDRGIEIPKNAIAWIKSQGVMSGNGISIEFKSPCSGADCVESGDNLEGKVKGLLYSMVDPSEIPAYTDQLGLGLSKVVDSLMAKVGMDGEGGGGGGNTQTAADLKQTVANMSQLTARLNVLLSNSSGKIDGMLTNFESITSNLASNNAKITELLSNTTALTGQLKNANLGATVGKVNTTMDGASSALKKLETTLAGTEELMANLTKLTADMKNGKGSMGKILQSEELYNNLNKASGEMALLLQDVRLNPKRYTRILSKKEKPYVYPEADPAAKQN